MIELFYYIIFIGVYVAIRLVISFVTSFINIFNSDFKLINHIQLLNNVNGKKVEVSKEIYLEYWKLKNISHQEKVKRKK